MTDPSVPDRPVICPYDDNHSIAESRLLRHILKCSKNFPPDYRTSCPYNATHRLPKAEWKKHVDDCPDKRRNVPNFREDGLSNRSSGMMFEMEDRSTVHCDESWDQDDGSLLDASSLAMSLDESINPLLRTNSFEPSFEEEPTEPFVEPATRMRPPTGRAEALMLEMSEDSIVEDMESVASFMGMGRGKPIANRKSESYLRIIGKGRGASLPKTEI